MLAAGTPFYNRILLSLIFSRMDETMRKWMKINQKTADNAEQVLDAVLADLAEARQRGRYLAGDQFTRADLAAGALLAPLFQPPQYPVPWPQPKRLLPAMKTGLDRWQPQLQGLAHMYQQHR